MPGLTLVAVDGPVLDDETGEHEVGRRDVGGRHGDGDLAVLAAGPVHGYAAHLPEQIAGVLVAGLVLGPLLGVPVVLVVLAVPEYRKVS